MDGGVLVETLETATTWDRLEAPHAAVGAALAGALAPTPPVVGCHVSHLYPGGASLYFTVLAAAGPRGSGGAVAAREAGGRRRDHRGGGDHHPPPRGRPRPCAVAGGGGGGDGGRGAAGGEGGARPRGDHEPGEAAGLAAARAARPLSTIRVGSAAESVVSWETTTLVVGGVELREVALEVLARPAHRERAVLAAVREAQPAVLIALLQPDREQLVPPPGRLTAWMANWSAPSWRKTVICPARRPARRA